jgi:hypothetical protein
MVLKLIYQQLSLKKLEKQLLRVTAVRTRTLRLTLSLRMRLPMGLMGILMRRSQTRTRTVTRRNYRGTLTTTMLTRHSQSVGEEKRYRMLY